jgi:circadian clock protein KaiB
MKIFEPDQSVCCEAANAEMSPAGGAPWPERTRKNQTTEHGKLKFILYVAGKSPNSERAIANLQRLCADHILDEHELEIVDVLHDPHRAIADGIMLTPTLSKVSPGPIRMVVGALNFSHPILQALGLPTQDVAAT